MRRHLLAAIVGVTLAAPGWAEEPASISEAELLRRVEERNPRAEAIAASVDVARAEEAAASILANPSVGYTREEVFPDGGAEADQFVRLAWALDLSGRRGKRIAAARAGTRAAAAEADRSRLELVLAARDTYHDAAYQRARVTILREGRDGLAGAAEAMRARAKAGDVAGYDADRIELELADLDETIAEADAELARSERGVARAAGGGEDRLAASDAPALPPEPSPLAALLDAGREHPELRAGRLRAEQARQAGAAARRGWIPSLLLEGGLKTTDAAGETATGYFAGIGIELPIFDHGQGDRARADAARRVAEAETRALEREVPSRIREAHADLTSRREQATTYAQGTAARAADLVRRAETSYREGERSIVELVDAHRTARDTKLRALTLIREAQRAEGDLWRALGRKP